MGYLIRKIARSKWVACDKNLDTPLSADAITNCLRTTSNTLSVWYAEDEDSIAHAKLALLASLSSLESIDIVILSEGEIRKNDLILEETEGKTVATSLKGLHRDIAKLSIIELKKFADLVRSEIVEKKFQRITLGEMKGILNNSVKNEICKKNDFPESLQRHL